LSRPRPRQGGMHEVSTVVWLNGEIVERQEASPSISSVSLHLGIGVFDGLMAYWNRDHYYIHKGTEHFVRFCEGSARMNLRFPWSAGQLEAGMHALLDRSPPQTYYVRPIAYRGGPQIFLTGSEARPADVCIFGVPVERDSDRPMTCQISTVERTSCRSVPVTWKICGSYVNSYLARRQAETAGFDDAIMLDRSGNVTEASAANVFFIRGDTVVTPRLSGDVFPGITRTVILDLAAAAGLTCLERDLTPGDLDGIEGAFLCSTLMEIRPVSSLGAMSLATAMHPTFLNILTRFRETTHA
jgi:branched-chain amino acid aminotransferase